MYIAHALRADAQKFGGVAAHVAHTLRGDHRLACDQHCGINVAHAFGVDLHLAGLTAHGGVAHALGADLHIIALQVVRDKVAHPFANEMVQSG